MAAQARAVCGEFRWRLELTEVHMWAAILCRQPRFLFIFVAFWDMRLFHVPLGLMGVIIEFRVTKWGKRTCIVGCFYSVQVTAWLGGTSCYDYAS